MTAERDDLLLQLNDYRAFKEKLKWKMFEQDVILKALSASMKQLRKT